MSKFGSVGYELTSVEASGTCGQSRTYPDDPWNTFRLRAVRSGQAAGGARRTQQRAPLPGTWSTNGRVRS